MKDKNKEVKSMLDELSEEQFFEMLRVNKIDSKINIDHSASEPIIDEHTTSATPQEDFRDWMVRNFYAIEDNINEIVLRNSINQGLYKLPYFNDEQIIDELVETIREGIFNVIDTYEGDK